MAAGAEAMGRSRAAGRRRRRGLTRLPLDLLWQRTLYRLRAPLFRSLAYRLTLPRRSIGAVADTGPDPWPGNAGRGGGMIQGEFALAGQTIVKPAPFWSPPGAGEAWLAELHGFAWMRDLRAVGGDAGRRAARDLVGHWIERNQRWSPLAWRPDILGQRLAAWIGQFDFYGATADAAFRSRFLASAGAQACHLARVLPGGLAGSALLVALKGLIYAGLALPNGAAWLARGRDMLDRELARQLLLDGGHVERSPAVHLAVLRHLIDLRTAFNATNKPPPRSLLGAIDGMAPMLRLYQHGDGGLALFNDSNESEGWQVDMVLSRADGKTRGLTQGPQSGFHRLVANRTAVIVECGAPPPPGLDAHAHAGTLAFEMSIGRERLIVNCGAHPGDPAWRQAQRATAAHSTLTVDDTNSATLLPEGGIARGPAIVTCRREETDGNAWLDMSHDGYEAPFGLVHRRRLYLAAGGEELRGEDRLVGRGGKRFAIRFHLHPQVQVSVSLNNQAAILRLPSGAGWRLRAAGAALALEESVYLGKAGEARRTQQVVMSGAIEGGDTVVKWALAREKRK